jgi:glutamate dehydrogenase/leucine dehydrogenase
MELFDHLAGEYEQVVWCHDPPTGLRAIVAIHSTALGPALGGTRYYPYATEDDALIDVLRLAKGMTYKSALAGLDLGGGKAVIIGDPQTSKSEGLLRAYGRFVDTLGGRYLTAEDVGTTQADMDMIRRETPCVTGVSRYLGGSGDPSNATAHGVWWAMRAMAAHLEGSSEPEGDLSGHHVVVVGVGKVGSILCRLLAESGAKVTVSDVNPAAVERVVSDVGAAAVGTDEAYGTECDLLAPCALGGTLNDATVPALRCRAVVGAANNQLSHPDVAAALSERGIAYAPDFVVNAGGVIDIADGLSGYHPDRAEAAVRRVGVTTLAVLGRAAELGTTTVAAAEALAEQRISAVSGVSRIRTYPRT